MLFNASAGLYEPIEGFFADPTPWDNWNTLAYTADTLNTEPGWLNVGRSFGEPTGEAVDRIDMLMLAMHEIGHALGLDYGYSGLIKQGGGEETCSRSHRRAHSPALTFFLNNGPHIGGFSSLPLMISGAPGRTTTNHRCSG